MDDERKHGFKAPAAVSAARASSSSSSSSSSTFTSAALSRHAEHTVEDHRQVLASVGMLPPTTNWSYSEHSRFMRALEVYGTDSTGDAWKRIAMFVRTRTIEEVRLHGRQYLQQLMRDQQRRHHRAQFESDARVRHESQNDPNGPNHAVAPTSSDTQKAKRRPGAKVSVTGAAATAAAVGEQESSSVFAHPLSCTARSAALEMKLRTSPSRQGAKAFAGTVLATAPSQQPRKSTRRSKEWSFDDDKALETSLASWPPGRAYSWPKIAASIPGKTAKDVRLRYEQLVEDVASIESADDAAARASALRTLSAPSSQSLSSRIAPPPPIQVPPPAAAASTKAEKLALDSPSFDALRSRGAKPYASGMLSPTFFDFLGADDKSSADFPSPLLPSPIVGAPLAGSGTSSLSPCPTGPLLSPLGLDLGPNARKTTTPRVWHDFLADDLKLEGKTAALRAPLEFGDTEEKRSSGDM